MKGINMKQLNSHNFEEVYKKLDINLDTLGCVMLDLEPLGSMGGMVKTTEDLYYSSNPDRKWIDGWVAGSVPHITLLYGLLDNAHNWEKHIKAVLDGWKMDTVEIDHIGYFESPYGDEAYYCLVAHIKVTPKLMEGHNRLEFLPHINTFTGYKPHMTIGYIKKDETLRDDYLKRLNDFWVGKKITVKEGVNLGYKTEGLTMTDTKKRLKFEERLKTIVGGYCYARAGGDGGYDIGDIVKHIDKAIQEAVAEERARVLAVIQKRCRLPIGDVVEFIDELEELTKKD